MKLLPRGLCSTLVLRMQIIHSLLSDKVDSDTIGAILQGKEEWRTVIVHVHIRKDIEKCHSES